MEDLQKGHGEYFETFRHVMVQHDLAGKFSNAFTERLFGPNANLYRYVRCRNAVIASRRSSRNLIERGRNKIGSQGQSRRVVGLRGSSVYQSVRCVVLVLGGEGADRSCTRGGRRVWGLDANLVLEGRGAAVVDTSPRGIFTEIASI
jgi:hypothetical protein